MIANIDKFKKWVEENKEPITRLYANNGGSFNVSGWGSLTCSPDWPVQLGLEQNEAFELQYIGGCFNGAQIVFGDEFNVFEYFHKEIFVPYMNSLGFEWVEGGFNKCDHKWSEYENERVGTIVECSVCKAFHPKGRPDMVQLPHNGDIKFSRWEKITKTNKNTCN